MTTTHDTPNTSTTAGLADRALAAARRARDADRDFDTRVPNHHRATHRRTIAETFARGYGLDPADVTVTDDPDRTYGTWRGFLVTITESGYTWTFLPATGSTDVFLAVGPCPDCHRDVPLADATDLAAFGRYLDAIARHADLPHPLEFHHDPRHAPACRYRLSN